MSAPSYTDQPLERRLVESLAAYVSTPASWDSLTPNLSSDQRTAIATALSPVELRGRDEDTVITPQDETAKNVRLIMVAQDTGRVLISPVRSLDLRLTLRANVKTDPGKKDAFDSVCAALELLLDHSNLKSALDSATLGVRVMLAVRRPGCTSDKAGDIHTQRYTVEVKAVPAELTA